MVAATSSNSKVTIGGLPVLRATDTFVIAGCPLNVSGAPHPCMSVQWTVPNTRSQVLGDFTLSDASIGMCVAGDQAPQGPVLISTPAQVTGL
jgi:hypothetical protein